MRVQGWRPLQFFLRFIADSDWGELTQRELIHVIELETQPLYSISKTRRVGCSGASNAEELKIVSDYRFKNDPVVQQG